MSETAGWGTPGWLPPAVARRMALDDAEDARQARQETAERERRAEDRHQRTLASYQQEVAIRGEEVSVLDLAAGRVPGRTVSDVLQNALTASQRQDAVDAARLHRDGHGEPERLHISFAEPNIIAPAARSENAFALHTITRRFFAKVEARRALDRAERAADASVHDWGVINGVTRPSPADRDPILWLGAP